MRIQTTVATLALAGVTMIAQAVPVITTDSQTNGTSSLPHTYVPSSADLLNGLTPSAEAGTFTLETAGGTPVLTDGAFPSPILGLPNFQFGAFATGGNGGGTSVTYTLALARDIASINVFGGWQDAGRDQQSYSIFYSTAVAPGTFLPLTTVDFNPPATTFPQVTRVTITDTTGTLAANVQALRFDFGATENGYSGYAEIDAFAVPEPGSAAIVVAGLSMVGALRRRRV